MAAAAPERSAQKAHNRCTSSRRWWVAAITHNKQKLHGSASRRDDSASENERGASSLGIGTCVREEYEYLIAGFQTSKPRCKSSKNLLRTWKACARMRFKGSRNQTGTNGITSRAQLLPEKWLHMQSAIPEQIATNRLGPSASAGSVLMTEQPLFGRTQQREKKQKKTEQLSKNGWRLRALNNADIKKVAEGEGGVCIHLTECKAERQIPRICI